MSKGYALVHIDDVEDLAPKFGMDFGENRVPREALGAELVGVSFYRFHPGKRIGFGHRHDAAEEVYMVVEGSGRVKIEDEILEVGRYDFVRCEPAVVREFEAGPDGMVLIAMGNRVAGDGELIQNWWTD